MATYSRAEAAKRSGLDPGYIDRLIELGIITPGAGDELTKGDLRRALMAQTLENAGIELERLGAGIRDGHLTLGFLDSPTFERFATLGDETFQGLSERTGLPLHLLVAIRQATGAATPDSHDRLREDELAIVPHVELQLALGFRPVSIERWLRVVGESLRRAAETESDAWRSDLMEPMVAAGATVPELAAFSASEENEHLDRLTDQALLALWHAQQVHSWTANIIGGFEQALTAAGMLTKRASPPAICFFDIAGYTRLTYERGDEAAAGLAAHLGRLVNRTSIEHGGRPVKWLGDGVMIHFREPGPGVMAALEMVEGVRSAGLPPAHVGLHAGPVLFQEGDYFGQTVNIASRIAEYARPGEVLVTQEVVDASGGAGATFTEIGPVELKGMSGAIRLHAARPG